MDQLHGECYVELAGEGDLGRALEKHALRVGSSYRKRLIEVFCATFEEMKHALAYSLDREERERKRLLRGGRKGNRRRGSKPGRRERRGRSRSWSRSRSRSRSRSGGRRSRSRSSRSRSRGRRCRSRSWSRERRSSKTKRRRRRSSSASDSESSRSRSPLSCSYDTPSPASRREEEVESVAESGGNRRTEGGGRGGQVLKVEDGGKGGTGSISCSEYMEKKRMVGEAGVGVKLEVDTENNYSTEVEVKVELEEVGTTLVKSHDVQTFKDLEISSLRSEMERAKVDTFNLKAQVKKLIEEKEAKGKLMRRMKMNELIIADLKKTKKDYEKKAKENVLLKRKVGMMELLSKEKEIESKKERSIEQDAKFQKDNDEKATEIEQLKQELEDAKKLAEKESTESERRTLYLQESVNQLCVEKELMTGKIRSMEKANEGLRTKQESQVKMEEKMGGFLEAGRQEIAGIKEEVRMLKFKSHTDQVMLTESMKSIEDLQKENLKLVKQVEVKDVYVKTVEQINSEQGANIRAATESIRKELDVVKKDREKLKKHWGYVKNENEILKTSNEKIGNNLKR